MKKNFFDDTLDDEYYKNFLYGFASAQSRVRYSGEPGGGGGGGGGMGMTSIGGASGGESVANLGGIPANTLAAIAFGNDGARPY